ncbi:MAG TPA: GDCCVxC domain-containing (seleno)protein [Gaiellaceae bacterium]
MATVVLSTILTCPECGFAKAETMPTDACQFFYTCSSCGELLRPLPGDCCVFCSYADQVCPPKQTGHDC